VRSLDAMDLAKRAKAAGMRGFVIKMHLDQTAGLAYYMRKLNPDMEIFGGMASNLTTGPKVNPWAITHMAVIDSLEPRLPPPLEARGGYTSSGEKFVQRS